jgi:hypothetical protein
MRRDELTGLARPVRYDPVQFVAVLVVALIVTAFCALMLPISKSFPFTDDWAYVSVDAPQWSTLLQWAFLPHNEHFIPLIKLAQYGVLNLSGFDFRALIALNVLVGVVGTFAALDVARTYRGFSRLGDLMLPLLLLNLGFGLFNWGFSGQFVLSVSALMLFLALFCRAAAADDPWLLVAALAPLGIATLSGLNGLAVALLLAGGVTAAAWAGGAGRVGRMVRWGGAGTVLALAALYVATRAPQVAPAAGADVERIASWAFHMLKSSFVLRAIPPGNEWRSWLVGALLLSALAVAAVATWHALRARRIPLDDAAVHVAFGAHLVLAGVIIAGRSGGGPWSGGLEMHYGYLLAPLVVLGWIVLSRVLPRLPGLALGGVLVVLYADAAWAGAAWRMDHLRGIRATFEEVLRDLRGDVPPSEITARHMKELFYIDTPEFRAMVERDILRLRQRLGRAG